MHDVRVTCVGVGGAAVHSGGMQDLLERQALIAISPGRDPNGLRAAMGIIDTLARTLAQNEQVDRAVLVQALQRSAGYAQADAMWPDDVESFRAELVARLAERLARG
jgi:hypothetical protein